MVQDTCEPGDIVSVNGGPGSPGGDGGHGGKGGHGGQGGRAFVWRVKENQASSDPCNGGSSIIEANFSPGKKGKDGAGGYGGQGGMEGSKAEFQVRTVERGMHRRRKRALPLIGGLIAWVKGLTATKAILGAAAIAGTAIGVAKITNSGSSSNPHRYDYPKEFACFLDPFGDQNQINGWLSRAPSGRNGNAGFIGHEQVIPTTPLLMVTDPIPAMNCNTLKPDILELLENPRAAFEVFDEPPVHPAPHLSPNWVDLAQSSNISTTETVKTVEPAWGS